MARVKVVFQAMYREIVGKREIIQKVNPNSTLRDLLDMLAKNYGREFSEIVDQETGEINVETWVLVNGKSMRNTNIELKDDDVVFIGVPMGGG